MSYTIDGTAFLGTTLSSSACCSPLANTACSSYTTSTLTASSHSVVATYTPTGSFQGSNGNTTVTVSKASATVTLSNLTVIYTGSAQSPTVTTVPAGLSHTLTGGSDIAPRVIR